MNSFLLSLLLAWPISSFAQEEIRVSPGNSIQAAVNGARPGNTIVVEEGIYQEVSNDLYGLYITTSNLTVVGEGIVRLIATGNQQTGVYVAPSGCDYSDSSCSAPNLQNITLENFSVEEFPRNGIQTRWVNGFEIVNCASINNLNNGLYPTLSQNGVVRDSFSSGSLDSALWVAGSQNVLVENNELTLAPTGLEITVSNQVFCRNNRIHDNTVGVGLYHANMAGNPPQGEMKNWIIEENEVYDNNLVNTAPEGSFQAALIPGFGIFIVGVSHNTVRNNVVRNNTAAGIAVAGYCTAVSLSPLPDCSEEPPITGEASADNNTIVDNILVDNAGNPPAFLPQGDIVYLQFDPSSDYPEVGDNNCFEGNTDPDEFTYFSSTVDGQLPTGGCSSDESSADSLAPSGMLMNNVDTTMPSISPVPVMSKPSAEPTSGAADGMVMVVNVIVLLFRLWDSG